ncbi:HEAT repeat domain-containing protein [Stenotrophomonas lactitubi]|jgi:hypothetical protein|uniref:HEAT repeat domain-containing protein n=1 Tax=Stenotrophomonas lactitubi TaxID=2045214 RepID=UPI00320AD533
MDLDRIDVVSWLDQILDQDPATFEDAYWGLRPAAAIAVPHLLARLAAAHDGYSRGKLLELLGESGDSAVIPTLQAELQHPLEEVRNWAQLALDALDRGTSWQPSMGA